MEQMQSMMSIDGRYILVQTFSLLPKNIHKKLDITASLARLIISYSKTNSEESIFNTVWDSPFNEYTKNLN